MYGSGGGSPDHGGDPNLSLVAWAVIPFDYGMVLSDLHVGILYLFAISSLGVYGIITAGRSSRAA